MLSVPSTRAETNYRPARVYRIFFLEILLVAFGLALLSFRSQAATPSPTGRTPHLFWTSARQAVWNQMVADNNIWWQRIKQWADGSHPAVGDRGEVEALAYQMTGNVTYGRKAWSMVQPYASTLTVPITDNNAPRILFENYVWVYDWIYPALSTAERQTYINFLNWMGDSCLGRTSQTWGVRSGNANGLIGIYFGLAFLDVATAPDNPRAGTFTTSLFKDMGVWKPVGGLAATGINRDTMRNAIAQYMTMATGGVWFEGTNYQFSSLSPLLVGVEGLRTATGQDYFPEVTAALPALAQGFLYQLTPDMQECYQWGDELNPRTLQIKRRQTVVGMLAGLLQNDPTGPYIQELVQEFAQPDVYYGEGEYPYAMFFLTFNPYAPAADWRTANLPNTLFGDGLLYFHNGWGDNDSFFGMHMNPRVLVDHGDQVTYQGDFQLYRHGEWALTHPIGYASIANTGYGTNSMLMAGMSSMQIRGPIAEETGANYAYEVGTTYGSFYALQSNGYNNGYYNPPPAYLPESTRSLLYLPSQDKHSDTIVVCDRTNCQNPQTLPLFSRYRTEDQKIIKSASALKQWCIHAPVAPAMDSSGLSWATAGGQHVHVSTLLPAQQSRTVINEATYTFPIPLGCLPSELKYQVRISPTVSQAWDVFLNVVQVYDSGTTLNSTLVTGSGSVAQGTLVQRSGNNDALIMFSAQSAASSSVSADLLEAGYTASWKSGAANTDLYLMDLDPNRSWSLSVDGQWNAAFKVSSQGVGRCTISGAGSHTLQLSVN